MDKCVRNPAMPVGVELKDMCKEFNKDICFSYSDKKEDLYFKICINHRSE